MAVDARRLPQRGKEVCALLRLGKVCLIIGVSAEFPVVTCLRIDHIHADEVARDRVQPGIDDVGAHGLIVGGPCDVAFPADAHGVRHILAQPEQALLSSPVDEFQLCRLELLPVSRSVRHVLEENIGRVHVQRLFVVLRKVPCRLRVKDFKVRQADHVLRLFPVGIRRKSLVARQIPAGGHIL